MLGHHQRIVDGHLRLDVGGHWRLLRSEARLGPVTRTRTFHFCLLSHQKKTISTKQTHNSQTRVVVAVVVPELVVDVVEVIVLSSSSASSRRSSRRAVVVIEQLVVDKVVVILIFLKTQQ